jgi:hypothetical protein
MARNTVNIVAIQPGLARRLASDDTQGFYLSGIQFFTVLVLAFSIKGALPEEMEIVAQFTAL